MKVLRTDYVWCEGHARLTDDGWKCRRSGANILVVMIRRFLSYEEARHSGHNQIVPVGHLYCPACNPYWALADVKTVLKSDQVLDLS